VGQKGDGTLGWLRERNRQRVLGALREQGRTSQAEIARATGLSRTTVSKVVAELKESGLVDVLEAKASGPSTVHGGRPSVQLALRDFSTKVVGVDFGHSHVQVAVGDVAHNVLAERRCDLDVNHRSAEALDASARMVDEVLAEAGVRRADVAAAGIGIPGPVDRARGTVGSKTILPGWLGLRIADEMAARLALPVEIENDANLGALAELTWGAGRDCSNFAYIKAATGIGAGIVIDGRLLRGATGTAGEIGHTTLDGAGALCYCGNRGCLETVASGPAIVHLVGNGDGGGLTLTQVIDLAAEGDVRCRRALSDAGREIGIAIAGLCNLINPERVVIGGVLSRAGDLVLDPIRASIRRFAVQAASERVQVVPAVFIERSELLGCLALALRSSG
jgi:predicted NBD/HSP70 family sugar kinase/biotin operon repressor